MVAVAPFRALRYDVRRVDLDKVTSPPHDCVAAEEAEAFRRGDPHSIVRVVLPQPEPGDGGGPEAPSKYARAAAALRQWEVDGVLVRDARAALYFYQINWGPADARKTMSGFLARLALDATGKQVHPHEKTLQRPKQDRLLLRQATEADVEPIWLLYRDPRGWVHELLQSNAFEELSRCTDEAGSEHRLWRVDRYEAVTEIVAQFDERELVIADGHHRYRTALDHFAATGRAEHGSILVCLVRDNDPGLQIVATHRLIHSLPAASLATRMNEVRRNWDIEILDMSDDLAGEAQRFVALLGDDGRRAILVGRDGARLTAHLLTIRETGPPASAVTSPAVDRLQSLAVTRVHDLLLREWGVTAEKPELHVRYARDAAAAVHDVAAGSCQFAVLLPPEPVGAVLDVAQQGQLMPQKATYFLPKLRSGLVLSPLDEPLPRAWRELAGDGGKAEFRLPFLG